MNNLPNWSVRTKDGISAIGTSPYINQIQEITLTGEKTDEYSARKLCEILAMQFIEGVQSLFGYTFKAACDKNTSAFFWSGGTP